MAALRQAQATRPRHPRRLASRPRCHPRPPRGHRAAAGDGDLLRTQLLDAAERLLGEKGSLDAVSLRQVAREVGVSATSVYLHFADKLDLFIAVCSRRFEHLAVELRAAREGLTSPAEQLRASGTAYVRFGLERPVEYGVLFGALPMDVVFERVPQDELVGMQALDEMADIVAAGIAAGDFRDVDPFTAAIGLWAVVHGLVGALDHGHGKAGVSADAVVEATMDMVLDGLRPRA
jgi:AcrR family transcriptional regulator